MLKKAIRILLARLAKYWPPDPTYLRWGHRIQPGKRVFPEDKDS